MARLLSCLIVAMAGPSHYLIIVYTHPVHATHSLRHTFRDRLRAVGCPIDMIDQIGGWRSVGGGGGELL